MKKKVKLDKIDMDKKSEYTGLVPAVDQASRVLDLSRQEPVIQDESDGYL